MSYSPWPRVSTLSCLTIRAGFEGRHRGTCLAFQELQKRAARGRNVVDFVRDAILVDRGHGVATARDGKPLRAGDGARQRLRPLGVRLLFEHADRAVPHDGPGLRELR